MNLSPNADPVYAYRNCSEQERRIVQLLAVANSLDRLNLAPALSGLGRKYGHYELDRVTRTLEKQGLMLRGELYRCTPLVSEVAMREVAGSGQLDRLVAVVNKSSWVRDPWEQAVRTFRIALHRKREADAVKALDSCRALSPVRFLTENPLRLSCFPWDPEWFNRLPVGLQQEAMAEIIDHADATLEAAPEALAWFERHADRSDASQVVTLARHAWLKGDLQTVRSLLPAKMEFPAHLTAGLLASLSGDDDTAIRYFQAGLQEWKTALGKRKPVFASDLEAGMFLLSLVRQKAWKELDVWLDAIAREPESRWQAMAAVLRGLAEHAQGRAHSLQHVSGFLKPHHHRFTELVFHCYRFWTGRPSPVGEVQAFADMARRAGWEWLGQQADGLMDKQLGGPGQGLVTWYACVEPWERTLRVLARLAEPPVEQGTARLTWWVGWYATGLSIEPKEQRRDKKGWSAGRKVALKTLASGRAQMAPQDARLAECIEGVQDYGYYGGTDWSIDMQRFLPSLVGHPLVFLEGTGERLEVLSGEPQLTLRQTEGGFELALEPQPPAKGRVLVVRETRTRCRVVAFKDEQLELAKALGGKSVLPLQAADQVARIVSGLSRLVTVQSDLEVAGDARSVPCETTLRVFLHPFEAGLKVQVGVTPLGLEGPLLVPGQGGGSVLARVGKERLQTTRDLSAEAEAMAGLVARAQGLQREPNAPGEWLLPEPEACLELLVDLDGVSVHWPEGERFKVVGRVSMSNLQVRVERQKDWFAVAGDVTVNETRVLQMQDLLRLLQATPGRFVALGNNEFVALTDELRRRLQVLARLSEEHRGGLRLHPLAAGALVEGAGEVHGDSAWQASLETLERVARRKPRVPKALQAELRPYQAEGFKWLSRMASWGVGVCLADDMGLGKTVQALAVILERAAQGPTLVVAPASVGMNWVAEAERFAPSLRVHVLGECDREAAVRGAGPFDMVVATYSLLHFENELLSSIEWETVVLDEAQAIKNHGTRRSQSAKALKAGFRLATSGTPIENHLGELWNLFDFLNPGLLGSLESFNRRFAGPIERGQDEDARQALKSLIAPFMLRRTKGQVLTELPPRTEITLQVELEESERALYEALRQEAVKRLSGLSGNEGEKQFQILAELMRLRRACCHPRLVLSGASLEASKLKAFGGVVDELLENRHRALVFSQFVDHLALVREYLDGRGIRYQYLDGSTPLAERKRRVEAFQGGEHELFLISLKAGGTGLNLTGADYVIHLDPWWNPAVEDQASDRAHRIGQVRPVTVYRLVTKGTIEEQIVALHADKRELADSLLSGTESTARLSAADLLRLLHGLARGQDLPPC